MFQGHFFRKPWLCSVCALTLGLFFLFAGIVAAGCGDDGDETVSNDNGDSIGTATASVGSRSTTDVPHTVTVTSFAYPYETDDVTMAPDAGLVMAKAEVKIVNDGDDDYEANANMFVLIDSADEDYVHYLFYNGDDAMGESVDSNVLHPGDEFEGALVFDVPPGLIFVGLREGLGYPNSGDLYDLP